MGLVAASRAIAMAHMVRRSLLTSSSALPLLVTPPSLFWGLPQPLHLNTRSMKMFWMCLAHWDKSNSYTSPECLLKVQLQQTGLSGELEAGLCSALFPSSRDWRLFSKDQENKHPTLKCTFQEVTLQILPFTELLSPEALQRCTFQQAKPPWGPRLWSINSV